MIAASRRVSQTWQAFSVVLRGRWQSVGVRPIGRENSHMKERQVDTVHTVAVRRKAMACQFEVIFNIPGMGRFLFDSINLRDYNAVMAILLVSSGLTLIGILLSDLSYAFVDPRIRHE